MGWRRNRTVGHFEGHSCFMRESNWVARPRDDKYRASVQSMNI